MVKKFALLLASATALALAVTPAMAKKGGGGPPPPPPTPVVPPSLGGGGCMSDLSFGLGSSSLTSCYGRFDTNLLNNGAKSDWGAVNTALDALLYNGPDVTLASFGIKDGFSGGGNSVIDVPDVFTGTLFFALKTGNGGGGGTGSNGTTFYRINAIDLDTFTFVPNGASSGGFIFVPGGPPVPEPGTWALLILGFGALGGTMRSAGKRRVTLAYG